jgi:hypothetical protein
MEQGYYSTAAFLLHQAAENLYHMLLVFTGYKPELHDLEKLKRLTRGFGKELLTIFPTVTEEERYRFQLLRRAISLSCASCEKMRRGLWRYCRSDLASTISACILRRQDWWIFGGLCSGRAKGTGPSIF